jgi:hypothetical protein
MGRGRVLAIPEYLLNLYWYQTGSIVAADMVDMTFWMSRHPSGEPAACAFQRARGKKKQKGAFDEAS